MNTLKKIGGGSPDGSCDDEVTEHDTDGRVVKVEEFDRNRYHI